MTGPDFTLYLFGSSVSWGFPYAPACDTATIVSQAWSGTVNGATLVLRNEARYGATSRHVVERAGSVARQPGAPGGALALIYSGNNEFLHISPGRGARGRGPALVSAGERQDIARTHRENLAAGIDLLRRAGIEVVLSTIPSNLRDWPPTYSVLAGERAETVERLYARAVAADRDGADGAAEGLLREVLRAEPELAQAHFRLGNALLAAGRAAEARPHLVAANDVDGRPIRATSPINQNIRSLAAEHGLRLLDAETSFTAAAGDRVCGSAEFWDDCHPRLDGYLRLAGLLSAHLADMVGTGGPPPIPSADEVCAAHGIDRGFLAGVYGRMGLYCYKHSDCWDSELTLGMAERYLRRALGMDPTSVEAHIAFALVLARRGDEAGARDLARAALGLGQERARWLLHGREARAALGALGVTDVEQWARSGPPAGPGAVR